MKALLPVLVALTPCFEVQAWGQEVPANLKRVYEDEFSVTEAQGSREITFKLRKGDRVLVNADGKIWAGNWFTGENGPRGWNNKDGNPKFPLPGSHPYCLLVKLDEKYRYVGDGVGFNYEGEGCTLIFKINDDVHGNGTGAFRVKLKIWRKKS